MNLPNMFDKYKGIITTVIAVVAATVAVIAWASDQVILVEAKQQLLHNEIYQESRIARKEDQVTENKRELGTILLKIGDDHPTDRELREINYLDKEIARLREEMENIRVELKTG